ncbi:MAG: hypothetical protein RJA22_722 [Verrucomicrobiota bacterium]
MAGWAAWGRGGWMVLLFLAAWAGGSAPGLAQGLWIASQAEPSQGLAGDRITLRGSLFPLSQEAEHDLYAVEARFVIHHGSGAVVTPNLLPEPRLVPFWEGLVVETNLTLQASDPRYLRVDFVATLTLSWSQPYLFTNFYPCQILVNDAVPPRLTITAMPAGALALTWPRPYSGWVLESSAAPGLPWLPVAGPVQLNEDQCSLTLPRPSAAQRFFRLRY